MIKLNFIIQSLKRLFLRKVGLQKTEHLFLKLLLKKDTCKIKFIKINFNQKIIINRFESVVIILYYIGSFYSEYTTLQYAILLKSADFFGLFKKFCEKYDHNRQKMVYTQSAQIVLQIFVLAHISACIFVTVAQATTTPTWIDKLKDVIDDQNPSDYELYISALYWSIITMVTLGYGDIVPISKSEIINESKKKKNQLKNDLEMLNNLIEERGLNNELKSKVRRYFEYLYKEKQKNIEIGQEMIGNLPPNLKDEVMNDLYSKLIKQQPLFSQNFTEQFIYDISLTIKEFKVGPELLIQKKQYIQDRLYIVLKGEVRLYWDMLPNTNTTIETLTKGSLLGLQDFITQTPVEYYSRSETVTSLGYIQYSEFLEILRKHPKDYETYHKLKDKLNIYRQGAACRIFCRFCKKSVHPANECPLITYQPNLNKIIFQSKKLELIHQERSKEIERNEKFKQNSRYILNIINDNANKAANDLFNESSVTENKQYHKIMNQNSLKIEQLITSEGESNIVAFKFQIQDNKTDDQQNQFRFRKNSYQNNIRRNTNDFPQLSLKEKKESQIVSDINNKILQDPSNIQSYNRNKSQLYIQGDEYDEKNKDLQKKNYSNLENGYNIISQNEKQSFQQVPSMVFKKTMQYPLLSLEEIEEMVQNTGEQEDSIYQTNKGKEVINQNEKQDNFFNNKSNFNNNNNNKHFTNDNEQNVKVPTINFFEQNNYPIPGNLQLISRSSNKQEDISLKMYDKQGTTDKAPSEDTALNQKRRTLNIEESDQHFRIQKKQNSNIVNLAEKYSTNINQNDTPMSNARYQPGKRRTSQNQNSGFGNNYILQNLPNTLGNSQQQIYDVNEEFELPFILLPSFDRPFNYTYYFPYSNPRQILRDIEDKRLQLLESKRKKKVLKKLLTAEKPKLQQQINTLFIQSDRKLL